MINMIKHSRIKILSAVLAVLFALSCITTVSAVTDQDMAQISVKTTNNNPTIDELITVTVSIDNYRTMSPRISAMLLSVSYDPTCFDYLAGSETVLLTTNNDDLTSISYDGMDKISFAYTYANTKKQTLPTTANDIFSFKLRVKNTVKAKTPAVFTVNDLTLYNGKNETKYSLIECKEPKIDSVTVWPSRPGLLLNSSDQNLGTYKENVTVTFDAPTASVVYEDRAAVSVTSPYLCSKNGKYTVTVSNNGEKVTQTFTIDKNIANISVKPGTYTEEYPLGFSPDYSAWVLLVTYTDGTYSELPMDDSDIEITGFNANEIGDQRLLIKYKDKTTYVNVRVSSKAVVSFTIQSPISKVDYLIGDDIDTTGGVLLAVYDDGTSEEIPITKNMVSGYDSTYVGEQTVTVTYAAATQTFRITYYPREAVDELILAIDALDLGSISLDSKDEIEGLITKYNAMTALEKSAVTNISKLEDARYIYHSLITPTDDTTDTATDALEVTTDGDDQKKTGGNVIWYVVAGIIILSVLGGIGYFLFIYFKRKKEIDEDEYYDDGDFEDDGDDIGDLSYEEDIINIEEEENGEDNEDLIELDDDDAADTEKEDNDDE